MLLARSIWSTKSRSARNRNWSSSKVRTSVYYVRRFIQKFIERLNGAVAHPVMFTMRSTGVSWNLQQCATPARHTSAQSCACTERLAEMIGIPTRHEPAHQHELWAPPFSLSTEIVLRPFFLHYLPANAPIPLTRSSIEDDRARLAIAFIWAALVIDNMRFAHVFSLTKDHVVPLFQVRA